MLSFDGSSQFLLFDGEKQTAAAERQNNELQEKRGDKGENAEENDEEERERGKEDVRWVKELHGANENNAESKDLKESLGRIKPGELTPILDQLKNMKHDDAMQILRNNFERLAGADSGISPQELANELEVNKDPKVRAACIYATRYFDQFAKAGNLLGADWTGPVIEIIDLDNAKKPGL